MLLLHGWPGSFVEFVEMIPMLTAAEEEAEVVFEVVAPSLPGYGFSEAAVRPGLGPAEMGHLFDRLMQRLGYNDTYYVQGGDWGSLIGAAMATIYPHRCAHKHTHRILPSFTEFFFRLQSARHPPEHGQFFQFGRQRRPGAGLAVADAADAGRPSPPGVPAGR